MEKFTESPWILDNDQNGQTGLMIHDKHNGLIAEVAGDDWNPAEALANARLIAAAPDLLYTLQRLMDAVAQDGVSEDCQEQYLEAEEAIKLALEGE